MQNTPHLLGLIGEKTHASLSPFLHNALARKYRLHLHYLAMTMPQTALAALPLLMRQCDIVGLNVTAPYKSHVVHTLDRIVGAAHTLGVVNTIARRGKKLVGYNTDLAGFHALVQRALPHATAKDFCTTHVALLGNGDTALTAAFAFWQRGVRDFLCCGRSPQHVRTFVQRFRRIIAAHVRNARAQTVQAVRRAGDAREQHSSATPRERALRIRICALHELSEILHHHRPHVICHTTSAPHTGAAALRFPRLPRDYHPTIIDVRYTRGPRPFLDAARARGCPTHDGLPMLLEQAAAAWKIWTDIDPDRRILEHIAARWQST